MPKRVKIPISKSLYNELETYAKKEGITVNEFIDKLLVACLRPDPPKPPLFLLNNR
jgi:hypothetical protein